MLYGLYGSRPQFHSLMSSVRPENHSYSIQDKVEIRFGNKDPKPTEYGQDQYLAEIRALIEQIPPAYREQVVEAISDRVIFANTLAEAIDIHAGRSGSTIHTRLPERLIELAEEQADELDDGDRAQIIELVSSAVFLNSIPSGRSRLAIAAGLTPEGPPEPGTDLVKDDGIPESVADVFYTMTDLGLEGSAAAAFMKIVLGVEDPDGYGMYQAQAASDALAANNAEAENKLIGLIGGDSGYTVLVSTKHNTATPAELRQSFARALANILAMQNGLFEDTVIRDAFQKDNDNRKPRAAIRSKLRSIEDGDVSERLENMRTALSIPSQVLDNASSVGLNQAVTNCITHTLFNINQYDPADSEIVGQMYPTLSQVVQKKLSRLTIE
ncbi:MAG: hypothetical protein VKJ04_09395 [Vampirovibrionales bacterium]|nr:hypothetical protein [Vampirovibrionales bacterium]